MSKDRTLIWLTNAIRGDGFQDRSIFTTLIAGTGKPTPMHNAAEMVRSNVISWYVEKWELLEHQKQFPYIKYDFTLTKDSIEGTTP